MLKIINQHLIPVVYAVLSILLAGMTSTTYADSLARYLITANSGKIAVGSNSLSYSIGQPFISTNYSSRLTAGFLAKKRKIESASFKLVATSNPSPICVGKSFDLTFQTTSESQSVDGVEFSLKFDPTKLQLNTMTNSGVLDDVLTEEINIGSIDFAAGVWDNEAPSGAFELLTLNFKVLAASEAIDLQFDGLNATFEGETLTVAADNERLVTQDCMACKVSLQGRPDIPPAHDRWKTDLKIYVGDKTPYTIKTDGLGHCILPESSGNYSICVKGSHTLANRIGPPLMVGDDEWLDFGTLLEGDVDDDNDIDLTDRSLLKKSKGKCQDVEGYIENADLDEDDCVKRADYNLFKANYKKPKGDENPAICEWDTSVTPKRLRKGNRDSGGAVTLRLIIPKTLTVGEAFNATIQVHANDTQAVDTAAAYLNFDPHLLRVNEITASEHFDSVLEKDFDNEKGEINFAAGAWDNEIPKGSFSLATVNLTLLAKSGEETLSFNTTGSRKTASISGGQSVIAPPGQEGEVVVDEPVIEEPTGEYTASGTILDINGNPIAGVTVQIGDKTVVTDASGEWAITELLEGEYQVIASKDSYSFPVKSCAVGNNENCTVKLKPASVLDIKVVPNSWKVDQGDQITYTIRVTNQGEETATAVKLTDILPEGTHLVSIEALNGGSCDADTVSCQLPDLSSGASATAKIVISNTQAKTLVNKATVTASEYPEDVQVTWTAVKPYLSVTLKDTPDPVNSGAILHYIAEVELNHNAPTTTATGIELVLHLPSGVDVKTVNTDYGLCDTSKLPTLICELSDLSIKSGQRVNSITVNVDVVLKDAGLLLLTHEASVTANEYPTHTDRERTKITIPEGIEVDIAFVIDVTGSMQEEINGVVRALEAFIAEIEPIDAPLVALVVFTDDVKVNAFTRDLKVLKSAILKLKASGGGSCPEASVEALMIALPHLKAGGDILFATDAAPYADADVEKVMTLLKAKGIRFNAMITGDCSNESDWNQLDE